MRRLLSQIALFIAMIAPSAIMAIPAEAQETWTCVYDFTVDDFDFVGGTGTLFPTAYAPGDGFESTGFVGSGEYGASISKTFGSSLSVTYMSYVYDYVAGVDEFLGGASRVAAGYWDTTVLTPQPATNGTDLLYEYTGTQTITSLNAQVRTSVDFTPESGVGYALVKRLTISGTGTPPPDADCDTTPTLTRPLAQNDMYLFVRPTDDAETEQLIQEGAMMAFSERSNAKVSAVANGTITAIDQVGTGTCNELTIRLPINATAGTGPFAFGGSEEGIRINECQMFLANTDNYPRYAFRVGIPSYIVTITGDDGYTYKQLVSNPEDYVTVGMTVTAGCWIGETYQGRIVNSPGYLLAFFGTQPIGEFIQIAISLFGAITNANIDEVFGKIQSGTVVWVSEGIEYVDAFDWYTLDPTDSAPCNRPEGYQGCIGDYALTDPNQWQTTGTFNDGGGVTLASGNTVGAVMNLDSTREPELIASVFPLGGSQFQARLQLGATTGESTFAGADIISIAGAVHVADLGDFYTVSVTNINADTFRVDYLCVRFTLDSEGNPETLPEEPPPPPTTNQTFYPQCETFEPLATDAGIFPSIEWHWENLDNFFQCDLMVLLTRLEKASLEFFRTIGFSIRWFFSVTRTGVDWFTTDFVYWLGGHFANIAVGQTTTITNSGVDEQCGNVFCFILQLLDNLNGLFSNLLGELANILTTVLEEIIVPIVDTILDLLNITVYLLFDLISRIIALLFGAFALILNAIQQAISLFGSFVNGWNNATPVVLDGLPNCNINPKGNGWCIALWMMENTVFSGRGALLIPLLIAFAYTVVLIGAFKRLRATIVEASNAL